MSRVVGEISNFIDAEKMRPDVGRQPACPSDDLLFEVVTRRYEKGRSILLTTNKPFAEWPTTFPNAACVVTLVDRLMHKSEIVTIDGDSYRLREAEERQRERSATRKRRRDPT